MGCPAWPGAQEHREAAGPAACGVGEGRKETNGAPAPDAAVASEGAGETGSRQGLLPGGKDFGLVCGSPPASDHSPRLGKQNPVPAFLPGSRVSREVCFAGAEAPLWFLTGSSGTVPQLPTAGTSSLGLPGITSQINFPHPSPGPRSASGTEVRPGVSGGGAPSTEGFRTFPPGTPVRLPRGY